MSIESAQVENLEDYQIFGWKCVDKKQIRRGRRHKTLYTIERNTKMLHYDDLVTLQNEYFSVKAKKKTYRPIDKGWCLLGFLCGILPCIVYVLVKKKQKADITRDNETVARLLAAIEMKATQFVTAV